MCGIAGLANPAGLRPDARDHVAAMCERLAHRGPDGRGLQVNDRNTMAFGHLRLSIIDLTDGGAQPMSTPDGRFWITYNGEFYNYAEVRADLERLGHEFRSSSDTEVLLRGYAVWGVDFLPRVRGMYAFAIWDEQENELLLARDPIGVKPLFWADAGDGAVAFGSELKAVVGCPGVDTSRDLEGLADYLAYGYVPHPRTAYAGIRELAPGHWLRVSADGRRSEGEFWDGAYATRDGDASDESLRAALADAVAGSLVADVPVGVLLSGGYDSTAVAALAADDVDDLRTFTMSIGDPSRTEAAAAETVARHLGTDHHVEAVPPEVAADSVDRMLALYDAPFADSSGLPTVMVSELARRHVKVAVSGDGGDEVFVGYDRYFKWERTRAIERRVPIASAAARVGRSMAPAGSRVGRATRLLAPQGLERYAAMVCVFPPDLLRTIAGPALDGAAHDTLWSLRRYWREDLDEVSRCAYVDLKTYLPGDILTKVDRAAMSIALEVRPPLLDHKLVETITALPIERRFEPGAQKKLLRSLVADRVPASIFDRPKQGFSLPLNSWLAERRGELLDRLRSGPICTDGLVRADRLDALAAPPFTGGHLWSLLVLDGWLRRNP